MRRDINCFSDESSETFSASVLVVGGVAIILTDGAVGDEL